MTQEERIERYFSGDMDDLERLAFDKEVMNDKKLAIAVKEYQQMLQGFKTYGLQQKLGRIMEENMSEQQEAQVEPPTKNFLWLYIVLAAILAAAFYFLLTGNKANETEVAPPLYMAYYYPDPGLPTKMGDSDDFDFDQGMVDYKLGDYKKAIVQWEKLLASDTRVPYFLGAAYLADNNDERAAYFLNKLNKEEEFYDRAQWYLALISLRENDTNSCMIHLNSILQLEQSPYQERASKLLGELAVE